jgi:prevent-host-death family protein
MEKTVGIEEARGRLGALVAEVVDDDRPVVLARRGHAQAVLVNVDEYLRFKEAHARETRAELADLLPQIRDQVEAAGLDPALVREAAAALSRLE